MTETDADFLGRYWEQLNWDTDDADFDRLFELARRGAEAAARIEKLEAEVKTWQGHAKTAIWSDSAECKMLTRINEALIAAPTVDIDVVVPDRDYSAMTPKDCYEAGLLDGVYQAREAIKAATRAALEERT